MIENRFGNTEVVSIYDDESLRGHGYGSKTLELLHQSKCGQRIMVDIEIPDAQAEYKQVWETLKEAQ